MIMTGRNGDILVGEDWSRARLNQATKGERYVDREERLEGLLRRGLKYEFMAWIFHQVRAGAQAFRESSPPGRVGSVSYTHLPLPTTHPA